jgi:hypothetical protein
MNKKKESILILYNKYNKYNMNIIPHLPDELVKEVFYFIPLSVLVWTNKKTYVKYHMLIKYFIPSSLYSPYTRDLIRRDSIFVFDLLIKEQGHVWLHSKKYCYNDVIYKNYFSALYQLAIEYQSSHCRNRMSVYLKKSGLSKNQHKKNVARNITWTN